MLSLLSAIPIMLAPSNFVRNTYTAHGVPADRVVVLPLGLDLSPWRGHRFYDPTSTDHLHLGYLGTLLYHKGVHILIKAFHRLKNPKATLSIYGFPIPDDPYIDELQKLAAQDSRVHLMGRYQRQDIPTILSGIDVVVIPSLWHETFSIVAREALLSSTPVIASRVGALPAIIRDGENGCLVPCGDVDALHAALFSLSMDRDRLLHLRKGARRSINHIKNIEDHACEIELIYEELSETAPRKLASVGV